MDEFYTYGDADGGFTGEVWERDDFGGFEFITVPNGDPDPYAIVSGTGDYGTGDTTYSGTAEEAQEPAEPVYINQISEPLKNEDSEENNQEVSIPSLQQSVTDASGTLEEWDRQEEQQVIYETDTTEIEELLEETNRLLARVEVRAQHMTIINNAQMGLVGMVMGAFIIFLFIGRLR